MIWQKLKTFFGGALRPAEFREEWVALLEQHVPLYARLPEELRHKLHERIAKFVAAVRFEGCGGLELTEEMIITVAAQACLLVIHREGPPYPKLKAVYLYPSTFHSVRKQVDELGIVTEGGATARRILGLGDGRLGLGFGRSGAHHIADGENVTFHEFAHQLDHEDGPTDGAPALASRSAYKAWSRVFHENYADFQRQTEEGQETVLDAYGATNPAEFFAVATETFFEKPEQLFHTRPAMYEEMRNYYGLDPRTWFE